MCKNALVSSRSGLIHDLSGETVVSGEKLWVLYVRETWAESTGVYDRTTDELISAIIF